MMFALSGAAGQITPQLSTGETGADKISALEGAFKNQQAEIKDLRAVVNRQLSVIEVLSSRLLAAEKKLGVELQPAPPSVALPVVPSVPVSPRVPNAFDQSITPAPLTFQIGQAFLTPIGFIDLSVQESSRPTGSSNGTDFGSIPVDGSIAGHGPQGRVGVENSRIGLRFDTTVKEIGLTGMFEVDFLGAPARPGSASRSNSPVGLRQFYANLRTRSVDFTFGQTWSLLTPTRRGLSPLSGDVFFTYSVDPSYQVGLPWLRVPQVRIVYRNSNFWVAASLEAPEQHLGIGSVLPRGLANVSLTIPNSSGAIAPDLVLKVANDTRVGQHDLHWDAAWDLRTFHSYNSLRGADSYARGTGTSANLNFGATKRLRLIANATIGKGIGRYLYGITPDFTFRPNGDLLPVKASAALGGIELSHNSSLLFGYYGRVDVWRALGTGADGEKIGFGPIEAPSSANRDVQETTIGLSQSIWRSATYGGLTFTTQYSYLSRKLWSPINEAGSANLFFWNVRYTLPGAAPRLK